MKKKILHLVAAARPNFMKVAPLYHALSREEWCQPMLIHTGQHYDSSMSQTFLDDLGLPKPDVNLGVGSGPHGAQTGRVMEAYEAVCLRDRPDWTVVVGDVNSTMACTLAAKKLTIPVAHLEAGLRSFDRSMPEEINRIVTDSVSDLLLTPSFDGDQNLLREGVDAEKIIRVGNIMIDSFEMLRSTIDSRKAFERFDLVPSEYGVVTIHRPANVDNPEILKSISEVLLSVSEKTMLFFSVHPRTAAQMKDSGIMAALDAAPGIVVSEPVGYCDFMSLVQASRLVLTDSGGLQEETSYLRIPCITLRENTERPVTVTKGTNKLATLPEVAGLFDEILGDQWSKGERIDLWDGETAARTVSCFRKLFSIE
ncbi:MAG: UDP-N-acetylglucosamine 2-epimerase (non-hydrolyzing) [Pseudodesulfovibrio sp.]|nr:UDP-N-acetylglucosamine 2-epimerase (non-hydrolyzing) [Pseudodesulfovibrio sp.]